MQALILGGARSGKSAFAERVAKHSGQAVVYIATAQAHDHEMQQRIAHHRATRPAHWLTVEEPLALAACLQQYAAPERLLLVDCLTLWLTNLLCLDDEDHLQMEIQALLANLLHLPGDVLLVSNEIGLGIVPLGELTRRYVDTAGRLHQQLAAQLSHVTLLVAGLPQTLKGTPLCIG